METRETPPAKLLLTPKASSESRLLGLPAEIMQQILGWLLRGSVHFIEHRKFLCQYCNVSRENPYPWNATFFSPELMARHTCCKLGGWPRLKYARCRHYRTRVELIEDISTSRGTHAKGCVECEDVKIFRLQTQLLLVCRQLYANGRRALYMSEFVLDRRLLKKACDLTRDKRECLEPVRRALIIEEFNPSTVDNFREWILPGELCGVLPSLKSLTVIIRIQLHNATSCCKYWCFGVDFLSYWIEMACALPIKPTFVVDTLNPLPFDPRRLEEPAIQRAISGLQRNASLLANSFQAAIDERQAGMEIYKVLSRFSDSVKGFEDI